VKEGKGMSVYRTGRTDAGMQEACANTVADRPSCTKKSPRKCAGRGTGGGGGGGALFELKRDEHKGVVQPATNKGWVKGHKPSVSRNPKPPKKKGTRLAGWVRKPPSPLAEEKKSSRVLAEGGGEDPPGGVNRLRKVGRRLLNTMKDSDAGIV